MSDVATKEVVKPMLAVKRFIEQGTRPADLKEFAEFWKSCSDAEKAQYAKDSAKALNVDLA